MPSTSLIKKKNNFDSDSYGTPDDLFACLNNDYGPFDVDLMATPENSKVKTFLDKEEDALVVPWSKYFSSGFMNPPYSRRLVTRCMEKAVKEAKKGMNITCLLKASTGTNWWRDYCTQATEITFLVGGRVSFLKNGIPDPNPPFESAIVWFNHGYLTNWPNEQPDTIYLDLKKYIERNKNGIQ